MNPLRLLGLVLFVVGILLLGFGLRSTDSMKEKAVEKVSGRYTDDTMWYLVGGIAMLVGGGALTLFGRQQS